jgi:hypothetical protein
LSVKVCQISAALSGGRNGSSPASGSEAQPGRPRLAQRKAGERWCNQSRWDYSDLKALFFNCTLKRSPALSHTDGLICNSRAIMQKNGLRVEVLRPLDDEIAAGGWV